MKKLLILLVLVFALFISSSLGAITGCTEIAGEITECTGALSGTTLDTDNTSIWIHDATHTSGLTRLNTTLVNGFINVSNFTVTSPSTSFLLQSDNSYFHNFDYSVTGSSGGTGSTGSNCLSADCTAQTGGGGSGGAAVIVNISSTVLDITNTTFDIFGGTGGTGGKGGDCGMTGCDAGGGGAGGAGGASSLYIKNISSNDILNNITLYVKGGTGGKGGTNGGCNLGGGGWSGDGCYPTGNGNNGGAGIIIISGKDMSLINGALKFTSTGGSAGSSYCYSCSNNRGSGSAGSAGQSTSKFNIAEKLGLNLFNLSFYNPVAGHSILNFTNADEAKIGFFNTSEVLYATDVYCTASDIIYGNDSTVTAPDAELDWTNCPAYADGNITYLTYEEFFGELRNFNLSINNTVVYETAGLTGPTEVDINITVVNNFLDNCTADANGLCDLPISALASNIGTLNISNVVLEIEDYSNLTCNFYLNDTINSTQELQYNAIAFNTTTSTQLENNLDYTWQQTCYSKGTNYTNEEYNHSGIIKVGDINPVTWNVVNNSQISPDLTIVGLFNDTRGGPVATHNFSLNVTNTNGITEYTIETNSTGGFTKQLSLLPGFNNISYFIKLGTQSWEDIGLFEVSVFNQSTDLTYPANNTYYYYQSEFENSSSVDANYTWSNNGLDVYNLTCSLYVNDILNQTNDYGVTTDPVLCYQEDATVATACGGLDNGTYSVVPNYFYINYTVPSDAITDNVSWAVQHGELAAYNITVPELCVLEDPLQLRFYSYSDIVLRNYSSYGQCYNGTEWETISTVLSNSSGKYVNVSYEVTEDSLHDGLWNTFSEYVIGGIINLIYPGEDEAINITFVGAGVNESLYFNISNSLNITNASFDFSGINSINDTRINLSSTPILFIDGELTNNNVTLDNFNTSNIIQNFTFVGGDNQTGYLNIFGRNNITNGTINLTSYDNLVNFTVTINGEHVE